MPEQRVENSMEKTSTRGVKGVDNMVTGWLGKEKKIKVVVCFPGITFDEMS